MKLVSYLQNGKERAGLLWGEKVFDIQPLLPRPAGHHE